MSDFNRDNNRAMWFDIPVVDLERATSFYSEVLAVKFEKQSFEDFQFSVIEHRDGNGGCLVPKPGDVSPHGFRAIIVDSEGNRIVLHSEVDA